MILFDKTNEVPIRLVFRGSSTPDFVKDVAFTDDNEFMVFTDNDRAIPLVDFLSNKVNCYDAQSHYRKILDSYRNLPSSVPTEWRLIKRVTNNRVAGEIKYDGKFHLPK